ESTNAGEIPPRAESTAKNHALVEVARLRGHAGILFESCRRPRRATRPGFVSIAADFQKRCRRAEFISSRTTGYARRVRVPPRIMVRCRNFRPTQIAQYRPLHCRH